METIYQSGTGAVTVDRLFDVTRDEFDTRERQVVRVHKVEGGQLKHVVTGWELTRVPDPAELTDADREKARAEGRGVADYVKVGGVMLPRSAAAELVRRRDAERLRLWEPVPVRIVAGGPLPEDGDTLVRATVDSLVPGNAVAAAVLGGFVTSQLPKEIPVQTRPLSDEPPIPLLRSAARYEADRGGWVVTYESKDERLLPFAEPENGLSRMMGRKFYLRLLVRVDADAHVRWTLLPDSDGFEVLTLPHWHNDGYFTPAAWASLPHLAIPKSD